MARHDQQCNFRIAHENKEWIEEQAKQNRRSITAQFNWIIEEMRRMQEKREAKI